jgi:folate-binding protein YgfZ
MQVSKMKAALLPDRGIVKVTGADAAKFLNGLLTIDIDKVVPGAARYAALLTPQGKIIVDCIVTRAEAAIGGDFFLDCPRALASTLVERLNFYRLRAKVIIADLSETLGVMALWEGSGSTDYGLCYPDPRLAALGSRCILPPDLAAAAAAEFPAEVVTAAAYEAHRIGHGVPRGGIDFSYGDAFPHEADMDQLDGVDFDKGCYVGQEVVSRIEHRGSARTRVLPVTFEGFAPEAGTPVTAGGRAVGSFGSSAPGHGLALLRLDRVEDALASGATLSAGGLALRLAEPSWARFAIPGKAKAAE